MVLSPRGTFAGSLESRLDFEVPLPDGGKGGDEDDTSNSSILFKNL
jgi:hypothetical protein